MKVKINAPTIIQIKPNTYDLIAKGRKNNLQNKYNLATGDRIRIKEHTGERYTGREILATVRTTAGRDIRFKKFAILDNSQEGKQNKIDQRRDEGNYKIDKWNGIV